MSLTRRDWVVQQLSRYWPAGSGPVSRLAMPEAECTPPPRHPPRIRDIALPAWAAHAGVNGVLCVPDEAVTQGGGEPWQRVDWLHAIDWYVHGFAEAAREHARGPVHSYAIRLRGWDERLWQRAWVNRIALFLRAWAAHAHGVSELQLLGPPPRARIALTHDVDAIAKTAAISIKRAAFDAFKMLRSAARLQCGEAWRSLVHAPAELVARREYWCFERIMAIEAEHGATSTFNFHPRPSRGVRGWLMDPSYDTRSPRFTALFERLREGGWRIGLHPSFDAWDDADELARQRRQLTEAGGGEVHSMRQHWLRFAWDRSWPAQARAGLTLDTTLGFNDRPGFRNGAAVAFAPWLAGAAQPLGMRVLPLVIMDSHFYDYASMSPDQRPAAMQHWIDELVAVGGEASVVWHQRVFSDAYAWAEGYRQLLGMLAHASIDMAPAEVIGHAP